VLNIDYHAKWLLPLRILLSPVAVLYGSLVQLRNVLYDLGLFKSHRFPVKIISVGNLSAGGSGKTPLTMFLAGMLRRQYGAVAVVSRGYGRKSSGVRLVSDGNAILLSPMEAGDEPCLIANKLPGVIVVVAEKRADGIAFLLQNFKPAVILLDDAFQHRGVFRDLDVLLINAGEPAFDRWPLPAGFYREFAFNRRRSGMMLYTHSQSPSQQQSQKTGEVPVFDVGFKIGKLINLQFEATAPADSLSGKRVGAFAGIAHPQNFFESLQKLHAQVVFFEPFADHHDFRAAEVETLIARCEQENCELLLCTEKDLVKLAALQTKIQNIKKVALLALPLEVEIEKMELFEKKVIQTIDR
jgi:tetraacyldisaccharide 4'-kinase